MCLIEVEGVAKPIASCTVKVSDNLSIYTNSVMVRKLDKRF
jgi:NADH dehydrogenase/NADH:ubiquinone oxidoreductase subunit G